MADEESAESWFLVSSNEASALIWSKNATWPFMNISMDQFLELRETILDKNFVPATMRLYGSTITIFGIVCTLLLIGTLWKKAISQKNSFYMGMLVIAVLDLLFHILNLVYIFSFRKYRAEGFDSPAVMWLLLYMAGTTFALSLASDMCAVILTFERLLAIKHPQLRMRLSEGRTALLRAMISLLIILISATRMHHPLEHRVSAAGPGLYVYTSSGFEGTPFGMALAMISDMILPFALSALMLLLSVPFLHAVLSRKRRRLAGRAQIVPWPQYVSSPTSGQGPLFSPASSLPQERSLTVNMGQPDLVVLPMEERVRHATAVHDGGPNSAITDTSEPAGSEQRPIAVLTLSLDVLFLLNQLGYCAYCVVNSLLARHEISYTSTYDEFSAWIFYSRLESYAGIASDVAECSSHALNFVVYMALSRSMRKDLCDLFNCAAK